SSRNWRTWISRRRVVRIGDGDTTALRRARAAAQEAVSRDLNCRDRDRGQPDRLLRHPPAQRSDLSDRIARRDHRLNPPQLAPEPPPIPFRLVHRRLHKEAGLISPARAWLAQADA